MSEIFEMQEEGILCSECCGYIEKPKGFISKCDGCKDEKPNKKKRKK